MNLWERLQQPLRVKPGEWLALLLILPVVSIGVFLPTRSEPIAFLSAMALEAVVVWGLHYHRSKQG